jgi:drug/metabolite transporter (DMT)-like permease
MALCYLAWFGALKRIPTTTASTGLLLIPIIGALAAAVMLGEPLGVRELAAFALTLAGVVLELRRKR